ncbi:MAG: D-alanyl-D-alanine carboxypeptidase family protein [Ruminococcus sp.]|nr:D-alanyl-D-alanine carboxypeptidase family protein [Ruminococcus sp.]
MTDLSKAKNDFYTLCDEKVYLNEDAADALNSMMEDYANETALTDFIVYGTTETYTGDGSYCPKAFAESKAGYCVDLALNAGGYVLPYDGYDAEGWVVENCWKYGFIVRYPEGKREKTGNEYCPWHLRYVGDIHAAIMKQKSMCLEEYVDFLEQYTLEEPYSFSFNGIAYQIYSVTGSEDKLTTRVPVAGNYELSGDNKNSFIITALKN